MSLMKIYRQFLYKLAYSRVEFDEPQKEKNTKSYTSICHRAIVFEVDNYEGGYDQRSALADNELDNLCFK